MSDRERDADSRGGGDRADDFFRALSIPLLAHELKGPLAVIEAGVSTALERAAEGGADAAKLVRTLRRVLRSTRRAQALVDDLLEVGRAEVGHLERQSFNPAGPLVGAVIDAVEAMDAGLADRLTDQVDQSAAATVAIPRRRSSSSRVAASAIVAGSLKIEPIVARTARGWYRSTPSPHATIAVAPAASAVLRIEPRFPGSWSPWVTMTSAGPRRASSTAARSASPRRTTSASGWGERASCSDSRTASAVS